MFHGKIIVREKASLPQMLRFLSPTDIWLLAQQFGQAVINAVERITAWY